jgi:hypothetical protein
VQQSVVEHRLVAILYRRHGLRREDVGTRKHGACRLRHQIQLAAGERGTQAIEQLARRMHRDAPGELLFNDGAVYDMVTLSPGRITLTTAFGAIEAHAVRNISPAGGPSTSGLCA